MNTSYKRGFLYFSALAVILAFWGSTPLIATAIEHIDNTKPVITLNGDAIVLLTLGSSYTDAGATALDDFDGDITNNLVTVNPVDANLHGTYFVTYNVSDAAGNAAEEVTRKVIVSPIACDADRSEKADVNEDGIVDTQDYDFVRGHIGCHVSDGIPSCFKSDVSGDGVVNTSDYVFIRSQIGCEVNPPNTCDPERARKADVNGDLLVNTEDYDFVQNNIGCDVSMGGDCATSDVSGDGVVNTLDYISIRSQIGCNVEPQEVAVVEEEPVVETSSPRSSSSGQRVQLVQPAAVGMVLGASDVRWDLLTPDERAELLAPFRIQFLLFLQQLQALLHR